MGLLSPQISNKSMVPICRQLATSYEAGIPILRSLELVGDQVQDKKAREVLLDMKSQVQHGATLGDSARQQRKYLPAFFIELMAAGETGGRLDVMLRDLAQYYEDRQEMRRRIIGAMIYPCLQLSAAWFLGTFALGLVGQLNLTSTQPFSLEGYFSEYLLFQAKALVALALALAICIALSYMGVFRYVWGWIGNNIWPLKNITRKFALARFFRSMSLLVGSGMNMRSCITNSAAMMINPYMQDDLLRAAPRVAEGQTLVEAFSVCRYLTPVSREMIAVGEQTGNLEDSLLKVSQYHLEEASHAVQVGIKIMNVAIVLAVGAIVGYVIISFYGQLYGGLMDI